MLKKSLISLLVAVCVLGTVGTAFGAVFPDTAGTKYEAAADLLSSLGLLSGFPDGTFKPADTITRAQVAKIAVCALGLSEAAAQAGGATKFSDVPSSHWAAGYINIAADQGLIKGYADGTFKPEAPVTYAEALAIIVRLLGYDPVVIGTYPTNYIVKAYEIGLASGVTFSAGAPATRGDVALFFKNSLTIDLMEQVWSGAITTYSNAAGHTLLADRLGYESVSGWVLDMPQVFDTALDSDEVDIYDGVLATDDTYEVASDFTFDPAWLGQRVKAWFGDEGIIMAQVLTSAEDVITGVIKAISATNETVKIGKKTYSIPDPYLAAWSQNVDQPTIEDDDPDFLNFLCRAVLDGEGDVRTLFAWSYDDSVVVTKVTPTYDKFEGVDESAAYPADKFDLTVPDNYDAIVLLKNGKTAEIGDLAVGDVIYYYEVLSYGWFEVVDEKVSGELETIETDADENIVLTVDGEEYIMAGASTYSTDDSKKKWYVVTEEGDLADFAGEEVTLYLNGDGDVRHIGGAVEAPAAAELVGVVMTEFYYYQFDPTDPAQYFVKVFGTDGNKAKLELGEDTKLDGTLIDLDLIDNVGGDPYDALYPVGTLVLYTLDDDKIVATFGDNDVPVAHTFALDAGEIDEDARLVYGHRATSSTVFFHINFNDLTKWAVKTWDVFKTFFSTSDCDGTNLVDDGDSTVDYLVYEIYDHGVGYGEAEAMVGVVTGRTVTADGVKIKVLTLDEDDNPVSASYLVVNEGGGSDTVVDALAAMNYGALTDKVTDLDAGDYIEFEVDGEDFVTITEPEFDQPIAAIPYFAYIADWDAEDLVANLTDDLEDLNEEVEVIFNPEGLVFDVTGAAELVGFPGLEEEQVIQIYDLGANGVYDVVKIVSEDDIP